LKTLGPNAACRLPRPALAPHIQLLLVRPEIARAGTANTSRGVADGYLVPVETFARKAS